jgi:hypothetical protein
MWEDMPYIGSVQQSWGDTGVTFVWHVFDGGEDDGATPEDAGDTLNIEVEVEKMEYAFNPYGHMWKATVRVLNGSKKIAGVGDSPEEALTALVEFLAGAATAMDPDYQLPRRPR